MANEVRQDVNVQAHVSGTDQINNLIKDFKELYDEAHNIEKLDISLSTNAIDEAYKKLQKLTETAFALNDAKIINDDQLYQVADRFDSLRVYLQNILQSTQRVTEVTRDYDAILSKISNGGGMRLLSQDFFKSDNLETSAQWLERITKYVDELPDNSKQIINKEALEDAKKDLEEIKEQYKEIVKPDFAGSFLNQADSDSFWNFSYTEEELDKLLNNEKKLGDNSEQLGNIIQSLGSQFGLSNTQAGSLAKTLGAVGPEIALVSVAAAALIKVFKEVYDVTEQVLDVLKDIGVSLGKFVANLGVGTVDAFVSGLNMMADAFSGLIDFSKEAIDQLQQFADIGGEVQDSYFRIYTYLGEKAGADIINYTNKLGTLLNIDTSKLLKGMKGILAVTSQLGLDADGVTKYTKALNNFALDLSAFSGESIENITNQFENAINLGVLNSRSALAKALDLTDSDIAQFKSLNTELERTNFLLMRGSSVQGLYQKYMDTSVGKVTQLKNAWQNFLNTVGQLALQIYAIVAPVLTKLINLASYAIQVVAKFFNLDLSTKGGGLASPISNEAADTAGRYADNVGKAGKAIEDTAKKAKDATKKVASFDDVIQINDYKSTEQKNKDAADLIDNLKDIQNYDPAPWVDSFNDAMDGLEVPDFSFDSLRDKLKELLDDFKNWEEAIDWDKWRQKAADFGTELAKLANVIVDDEQAWRDLGDLIGNTLNVGLEFLNAFAKEFHFEQFGKDLAVAFKEIFNQLDEDLAADTIYNWLTGAIDMAIGFFKEQPLTAAADSISTIFAKLINSLSSDESISKIVKAINLAIDDIVIGIDTALKKFEDNNTVDKIAKIFRNIFETLGSRAPEIVDTLSNSIQFLLDLLGTTISESIDGFFSGLESKEGGVDNIVNSLIGIINSVFENIGKIGDSIAEHKDTIIKLITDFINGIFENAGSWGLELQPLVDAIIELLQSLDWTKIRGALSSFLDNMHLNELIGEIINTMIQYGVTILFIKLDETFNSLNTYVTSSFTNLGDSLTSLLTALVGSIGALIMRFFGASQEDIQAWLDSINGIFGGAFDFLEGTVKLAWDSITLIFKEAWAIIKGGLTGNWGSITQPIKDIMDDIWKIIKGGVNSFIELINSFIAGIDAIPDIEIGDFKLGFDIPKIPKLAIGAIVEKSTIANIGEDGAEAVLPLQKNTEWMDALASKLASQMNENGNAGGTVNIQMSNKNFYTRSEMLDFADQVVKALKVYGVNVSVAY